MLTPLNVDQLVHEIYSGLLLREAPPLAHFGILLDFLRPYDQKTVVESMMFDLEKEFLPTDASEPSGSTYDTKTNANIGAIAAIILTVTENKSLLEGTLKEWLASGVGGRIRGINSRRALLTALKDKKGTLIDNSKMLVAY
jgi:hypothetical protein